MAVGVSVCVGVALGVTVAVAVGVRVLLGVGVAVRVGVPVGVRLGVADGVRVGVAATGVRVFVLVGVGITPVHDPRSLGLIMPSLLVSAA